MKPDSDAARVLNSFRALVRHLRAVDRSAVETYGLGSAQIYVLHCLSVAEPLSVGRIADMTATDQSTVSLVISKLVQRGLVVSRRAVADARRAELSLSKEGRAVVRKLPLAFQEEFVNALEQLNKSSLAAIADGLEDLTLAMGIHESHPPMLLVDASRTEAKSRKRRPKKSSR